MRKFETGATRDTAEGKPEYSGFNCPLVEKAFGEYMHKHRIQPDGTLRNSSNWKKGIPTEAYQQSLHRHFMDLWLHYDGYPEEAVDPDIVSVLCAIRFNVNGLLHEILKENKAKEPGDESNQAPPVVPAWAFDPMGSSLKSTYKIQPLIRHESFNN